MFLKTVTSKGHEYIYLYAYKDQRTPRDTMYRFGRKEIALLNMKRWLEEFSEFPKELLAAGCTQMDLINWINKIEGKLKNVI